MFGLVIALFVQPTAKLDNPNAKLVVDGHSIYAGEDWGGNPVVFWLQDRSGTSTDLFNAVQLRAGYQPVPVVVWEEYIRQLGLKKMHTVPAPIE